MKNTHRLVSNSPEKTENLAAEFAVSLVPGDWVGLTGPLGAGKTIWARGIGRALGVNDHIVSPTYSLVNVYEGRIRFCHIDLYRVRSGEEIIDFGLDTYLDRETVVVVEWADNLPDVGLPFSWRIEFERQGENRRIITLRKLTVPETDEVPR